MECDPMIEDAKVCIHEQPKPSNAAHSPSNATDVLEHSAVDDYATVCIDEQPRPSNAAHSPSNATDILEHSAVDDYATVCIDEQPRPSRIGLYIDEIEI